MRVTLPPIQSNMSSPSAEDTEKSCSLALLVRESSFVAMLAPHPTFGVNSRHSARWAHPADVGLCGALCFNQCRDIKHPGFP